MYNYGSDEILLLGASLTHHDKYLCKQPFSLVLHSTTEATGMSDYMNFS